MPFITSFERIGIEKGRQEGQVCVIVRLLKRRWGTLAPELETRLSRLSLPQLELLEERLLDFADAFALQQWLDEDANRVN